MNRLCVWVATLTAATLAAADARAFTLQSPGGARLGHLTAGPDLHAPAPGLAKPAASQSGGYTFSGNSFNLSVTKNGHTPPAAPEPPKITAPGTDSGATRPGFFRRMLDWITGD